MASPVATKSLHQMVPQGMNRKLENEMAKEQFVRVEMWSYIKTKINSEEANGSP
jgi:hypothetical protein